MTNTSLMQTLYRLTAVLTLVVAAAGAAAAQNTKVAVGHFAWNGSLVPSFGDGGLVTTNLLPATHSWARAMAVDLSGRLIVAGENSDGQLLVACFDHATGALDPSFGIGGYVLMTPGVNVIASAYAVAIDPLKGDIVVAGGAFHRSDNQSRFLVARFTPDGVWQRDAQINFGNTSDTAYAVAIDGASRIVVAGTSMDSLDARIALARFLPTMALDSTFNGDGDNDGRILTNLRHNSELGTIDREQANGIAFVGNDIVIAGHSVVGYPGPGWWGGEFLVLRYKSSGALDSTFDGDGIAIPFVSIGPAYDRTFRANTVAVDSNGRILAAGRASMNSGGPHFALVRLNGNGSLDTTFSGDGRVLTSFGWSAPSEALALSLRGTSTIMVAGWSGTGASRSAVVTRYTSNGTLDTTFDGDGRAAANFSCQGAETATAIAIKASTGTYQTLPRVYIAGYASGDVCS
jgi:uncharacterized delta-60 repeat protein